MTLGGGLADRYGVGSKPHWEAGLLLQPMSPSARHPGNGDVLGDGERDDAHQDLLDGLVVRSEQMGLKGAKSGPLARDPHDA
jgi:hypothetical protein